MGWYDDPALDEVVSGYGENARALLHETSGYKNPRVYANYGHGDEAPEDLYGYEKWRIEKLRDLKRRFDPEGVFNYYNPVTR